MGQTFCTSIEKSDIETQCNVNQQSKQVSNITENDYANHYRNNNRQVFKKDQEKQQSQIHYRKIVKYLYKNQKGFDFYYQEFKNYFDFGDLSKQVNMQKEAWFNLYINDIIKSKFVQCNMKVDLLKDFFQLKSGDLESLDKEVKKKKKSKCSKSNSKQKSNLIKRSSISSRKLSESTNSSGQNRSYKSKLEFLQNKNDVLEEQQKKQIIEFLQSEALFYDHIFHDISELFKDLFYQKYYKKLDNQENQDSNQNCRNQINFFNNNTTILRQKSQSIGINASLLREPVNYKGRSSYSYSQNQSGNNNQFLNRSSHTSNPQNSFCCNNLEYTDAYKNMIQKLLTSENEINNKIFLKKKLQKWEEMCQDINIFVGLIEEFLKISYQTNKKQIKIEKQSKSQLKIEQSTVSQTGEQILEQDQDIQNTLNLGDEEQIVTERFFKTNSFLNTQVLKSFQRRNEQILNSILETVCENNINQTEKLFQVYEQLQDATPSAFGIEEQLCLMQDIYPYENCVQIVENMNGYPDPVKILNDVLRLKEKICDCIYDYHSIRNNKLYEETNIDGDQLMQVFCYILTKAALPELYNIFELVEVLSEKQLNQSGEDAYCFSMMKSAQHYLMSLNDNQQALQTIKQNISNNQINQNCQKFMDREQIKQLYSQNQLISQKSQTIPQSKKNTNTNILHQDQNLDKQNIETKNNIEQICTNQNIISQDKLDDSVELTDNDLILQIQNYKNQYINKDNYDNQNTKIDKYNKNIGKTIISNKLSVILDTKENSQPCDSLNQ